MRPLHERALLAADGLESKAWTAGVPTLLRECAQALDRLQHELAEAARQRDRMAAAMGEQAEALRLRGLEVARLTAQAREAVL